VDLRDWKYSDLTGGYHDWLHSLPLSNDLRELITRIVGVGLIVLAVLLTEVLVKAYMRRLYNHAKDGSWIRDLFDHKVFSIEPRLFPGIAAAISAPLVFREAPFMHQIFSTGAGLFITIIASLMLLRFFDLVYERNQPREGSGHVALKGMIQAAKVLTVLGGFLAATAILFDKSPIIVLSGLGAITAVLILVFKDAILGLVAGIQINANDMVELGDWIELPGGNVNGTVIDISLTTVKVSNFDKTIACVPSYMLISKEFINWRGMSDSGGRRIKRSIHLDLRTIRFAPQELIDRLLKLRLMKPFLEKRLDEIQKFNTAKDVAPDNPADGRRLTNAGLYRAYCNAYLQERQDIHAQGFTFLIRHLQPDQYGLPLQIYVFTKSTIWAQYEGIQADIFDHLIAVAPEFGLRIYQSPSGEDIAALTSFQGMEAPTGPSALPSS